MNEQDTPAILGVEQIKRLLPHRAPFLFVERITDIVPGQSATGWKSVAFNEPHFPGHFPQYAVMPGVLIIEAMAQTAGALVVHTLGLQDQQQIVYFMTIDKARCRRPVYPGVVMRIPVQVIRHRGPVWRFEGKAFVDDELCAEAEYSAMLTGQTLTQGTEPLPER